MTAKTTFINPFATGNFAQNRVLKVFVAIKSENLYHKTVCRSVSCILRPSDQEATCSGCVVVQFCPWFKFYFPMFLGMVIYDNEFETIKENKI